MTKEQMEDRLKTAYPDAEVEVFDLTGTRDHWEVNIKSSQFSGMNRVQQHQHVMSQFSSELSSGEVHALSIRTKV